MIYNLKNDFLSVAVSSLGAEIQSVNCCGKEYMWDGKEFWQKHSPLLFPICGSITSPYTYRGKEYFMEKHGFISDLDFKAVSVSDTELTLVAVENEKTLSAYPFKFEFTAKYTIDGKKLISKYTVKNTSDEVMPYMLGLHALCRKQLQFEPCSRQYLPRRRHEFQRLHGYGFRRRFGYLR